jgi:hypothetical protein
VRPSPGKMSPLFLWRATFARTGSTSESSRTTATVAGLVHSECERPSRFLAKIHLKHSVLRAPALRWTTLHINGDAAVLQPSTNRTEEVRGQPIMIQREHFHSRPVSREVECAYRHIPASHHVHMAGRTLSRRPRLTHGV